MDPYVKMYQFESIDINTPRRGIHSHSYHELYIIENSEVIYFINNQILPVSAGEMIFVPKGVMHYTSYEKTLPVRRHLIFFGDAEISEEMRPYIDRLSKNNHIVFPPEQLHRINSLCKKLQQEEKHNFPDKYQMSKLYTEELLILINRYRLKGPKTNISNMHRTIQNVASYISENITADLSLDTLSRKFSISQSHLSKQFKNLTGVGLNEYISISRINAAGNMLLNTGLSVTEVAFKCGFNDSNYFTRVFKRIKGITPKAYSMQK